jgi:hypothetical protein
MKFVILLFMLMSMSGCATHLTEAGRRIRLVQTGDWEPIRNCERLESVRGETQSFLSGGEYGVIYATNDARNKAARIPSADTLVITDNDSRRFGGEVTGIAYNCSAPRNIPSRTAQPPERNPRELSGKPAETPSKKISDDVFEKASKCQKKGGVWVNDACIIKVE